MDNDKIKVDLPKKKLNKMIHKEFRRQYVELLKEQEQEIERLNNIIEEVREYIEDNSQMTDLRIHGIENVLSFRGSVEELLEILDKEKK